MANVSERADVALPIDPIKILMEQSVNSLNRVGEHTAKRLERIGLKTLRDVMFHFPYRYQDRTHIIPMDQVEVGDEGIIQGEVLHTQIQFGRRRMLLVQISDGSVTINLRFFRFTKQQQERLTIGSWLRCFGLIRRNGLFLEMIHPEYQPIAADAALVADGRLTPVYPSTEGMSQNLLRHMSDQVLKRLDDVIACGANVAAGAFIEYLPEAVLNQLGAPGMLESIMILHRPPPDIPLSLLKSGQHPAQQRLAFDELLAHQLNLLTMRKAASHQRAPAFKPCRAALTQLLETLPFELTAAQTRVMAEISADLGKSQPMQRLVQGDVGSGKTIVAAAAVLQAIMAGYQVAVMAPTEILAEQHFQSFSNWLKPFDIKPAWLSGKLKGKARASVLEGIASGETALVVGTHAIFQDQVVFKQLGFVVIDEQHRFGVHQRLALRDKGRKNDFYPHQLIMTATPIPRTLVMTSYADLDCSVIDELPPGREVVKTMVIPDTRRDEIIPKVQQACEAGRQVYWVCTLIEESETLQCQTAQDTQLQLSNEMPELVVGLVHGRMKHKEKEQCMIDFKAGRTHILVATTVIEVGLDVPNASLMVIDNAERLGLAQLHQLRGRVGRGSEKSSCILLYHPPLSENGQTRLAAMRETNDGFEIARRDLELRGPGELLGTRQTGIMAFRVADIVRDQALIPLVNKTAHDLMAQLPEHIPAIIARSLGDVSHYGHV